MTGRVLEWINYRIGPRKFYLEAIMRLAEWFEKCLFLCCVIPETYTSIICIQTRQSTMKYDVVDG